MKAKPNILLISIDTLRADHLSCYGYSHLTTPNLDRLAAEGNLFRNAYSTATWTPPAHATMLSGLYPSQHGVVDENGLGDETRTLAEMLAAEGYSTAGFVNNSQVGALVGLDRGHATFEEVWKGIPAKNLFERGLHYLRRKVAALARANDLGAARTNELAMEWLRSQQGTERPFYLFLHYLEPHNPLFPRRGFIDRFSTAALRSADQKKVRLAANNPLICLSDDLDMGELEVQALTALYDGAIAYQDDRIREILELLQTLDLYQESLIIITADHGEHFGEHGLFSHVSSLYEPIVHVPLIVKFPRSFAVPTGESSSLVSHVDIVPTAAMIAGIQADKTLPGNALLPENGGFPAHEHVHAEWEGRVPYFVRKRLEKRGISWKDHPFTRKFWMTRDARCKYIRRENGEEELYDLVKDPGEMRDLIPGGSPPGDLLEKFRKAAESWQELLLARTGGGSVEYRMDDATRKNLENLGYM